MSARSVARRRRERPPYRKIPRFLRFHPAAAQMARVRSIGTNAHAPDSQMVPSAWAPSPAADILGCLHSLVRIHRLRQVQLVHQCDVAREPGGFDRVEQRFAGKLEGARQPVPIARLSLSLILHDSVDLASCSTRQPVTTPALFPDRASRRNWCLTYGATCHPARWVERPRSSLSRRPPC
jgi:hypothetical protein